MNVTHWLNHRTNTDTQGTCKHKWTLQIQSPGFNPVKPDIQNNKAIFKWNIC